MIKPNGNRPWGVCWTHRDDPVFEVNFDSMTDYPNGDRLPGIWITEPILTDDGGYDGRTYTMAYPYWDQGFPFPASGDEYGEDALYYGGCYYDEGMGYTDSGDREKRVDCFRAAEILYRHSAGRGNVVANLCLGYVYSYDRCEGRYWRDPVMLKTDEDYRRPYPREERAFECFEIAADTGISEACYKLGDLFKQGVGCSPSTTEAFRWYMRASELAVHERPVILGSIALRLGGCYEEGFGCGQDFVRALGWYEKAVSGLEFAVDNGDAWYEKALAEARTGAKRCRQEVTM